MPTMLDATPVTAEQLLALDEPGYRHELLAGELRRMSNAGWWHGAVAAAVCEHVRRHVREHRLGLVFAETGFVLARNPDTVRSPDAAVVRHERLPRTPGRGHFGGAPDLAVEVTSPHDSYDDVHAKVDSWLAHGAGEVWVVAAGPRHVVAHRQDGTSVVFGEGDVLRGSRVLPEFAIAVRELFPAIG
ncbi:MAG: Uma2 family endonuclease [Planctomycetota bacterium]